MKVYLIGAGPGDPGLLTLKGKACLEAADVVVYDALANDMLLQYARPEAERIYVGKVAGNHALPQDQINALIIRKAQEGKIVVRLKGGDPYIFGRGGEEAEELLQAGVPFEEVPGISSTIGGPAYAGIPLTHRSFSSSVTIITGHEDPTKPGSVHNWSALARSASTLVFVMGMKNLPLIVKNLMDAGMPADTPAALVYRGTTVHHRSLVSTLAKLPEAAVESGFSNPSVIVVGQVCTLHNTLNWFEQKPLLGKSVVVTRAREQASGLASTLMEMGADVIQCPTIAITPLPDYADLDKAVATLPTYQWIVFTSVNGVKYFWQRLAAVGKDSRALGMCKVAAIGPATADALRDRGIVPDFIPEKYVAEGVVDGLIKRGVGKGVRVLLPRAKVAREVLPTVLREVGAEVDVIAAYETVPCAEHKDAVLARMEAGTLSCITFGSSSTVENFLSVIPANVLKAHPEVKLAAIGPITAKTLEKYGFTCDIQPQEYTITALADALKQYL